MRAMGPPNFRPALGSVDAYIKAFYLPWDDLPKWCHVSVGRAVLACKSPSCCVGIYGVHMREGPLSVSVRMVERRVRLIGHTKRSDLRPAGSRRGLATAEAVWYRF